MRINRIEQPESAVEGLNQAPIPIQSLVQNFRLDPNQCE